MAKKTGRKGRGRMRKTRRRNQKQQKSRGGAYSLQNAANYSDSLAGSSPSQQSLAQGKDYGNYHTGQHGGVADYSRAFDTMTDSQMLSSSMSDGQLNAIAEVRGLHDAQPQQLAPTPASPGTTNGAPACGAMLGGRRRRSQKKSKKAKKSKKSKKSKKQQRRQGGGGALGYAPVGAPGLLLDNNRAYTQAGLNPEYFNRGSTEQLLADMRDRA